MFMQLTFFLVPRRNVARNVSLLEVGLLRTENQPRKAGGATAPLRTFVINENVYG